MREILFRGMSTHCNEATNCHDWYYGSLVLQRNDLPRISTFNGEEYEPVMEGTIGQFTGCLDVNGNKIFEGDIVEKYGHNFEVRFADEKGWFGYSINLYCSSFDDCKIIGNIHENRGLLNEQFK